jgi:hypothetical protein
MSTNKKDSIHTLEEVKYGEMLQREKKRIGMCD